MNKRILLLMVCMSFAASPLFAARTVSTDTTPYLGYRNDNLKWTIQDGSSFQWKNLNFIEYGINNQTAFKDRYILRYDLGLANLVSGSFTDNQYLIPGAASTSSSLKGWGMAFRPNLGLGYKFKPKRWFNIIPQVGYSYDLLYLNNSHKAGPFSSIKDTIQWHGPWTGFDANIKVRRWSFNLGAFYHLAFYRNNGNWKVSPVTTNNTFSQSGTGQGVKGRIGFGYEMIRTITLGAEANIDWKQVTSGNDTRNFVSGVTTKRKIKKVNMNSYGSRLTLTKTF